jgi:hypothetical protein
VHGLGGGRRTLKHILCITVDQHNRNERSYSVQWHLARRTHTLAVSTQCRCRCHRLSLQCLSSPCVRMALPPSSLGMLSYRCYQRTSLLNTVLRAWTEAHQGTTSEQQQQQGEVTGLDPQSPPCTLVNKQPRAQPGPGLMHCLLTASGNDGHLLTGRIEE